MNKTIFNKDYEYGTNSEIDTLSLMKKYFNDNTLQINNDKYGSFDYIGKDVNVELKTRRINYTQANTYGDLIFSYSKYKKWVIETDGTSVGNQFKKADLLKYMNNHYPEYQVSKNDQKNNQWKGIRIKTENDFIDDNDDASADEHISDFLKDKILNLEKKKSEIVKKIEKLEEEEEELIFEREKTEKLLNNYKYITEDIQSD